MFTGIVEGLGTVRTREDIGDAATGAAVLTVTAPGIASTLADGDSVSVDGVCLTARDIDDESFTADVMGETLRRSTLGGLGAGDAVNLERPLTLQARLGGHLVQGHVDAVGEIVERVPGTAAERVRVRVPAELTRYIVVKGSITLDGISLTVTAVTDDSLEVSLIPTTLARTTLGAKPVGSRVNVEVDMFAKYAEKLLAGRLTEPEPDSGEGT